MASTVPRVMDHCAPTPGEQWAKILQTLYFNYVPNAKRYEVVVFT